MLWIQLQLLLRLLSLWLRRVFFLEFLYPSPLSRLLLLTLLLFIIIFLRWLSELSTSNPIAWMFCGDISFPPPVVRSTHYHLFLLRVIRIVVLLRWRLLDAFCVDLLLILLFSTRSCSYTSSFSSTSSFEVMRKERSSAVKQLGLRWVLLQGWIRRGKLSCCSSDLLWLLCAFSRSSCG